MRGKKLLRAVIIDDEPVAREYIRDLLQDNSYIRVIGEAASGTAAVQVIIKLKPDLVFLDIQMPEMDGFEVLRHLEQDGMPHVIFVTAHDKYAIKAFEVNALDYLLKPFDKARFLAAVKKTVGYIALAKARDSQAPFTSLFHTLNQKNRYLTKLMVRARGRIYFLEVDNIDYIEAAGNYLLIHAGEKEHLIRSTMSSMVSQLNPELFARIHRSFMVNVTFIQELQASESGGYKVLLQNGERLTLSRTYRDSLLRQF